MSTYKRPQTSNTNNPPERNNLASIMPFTKGNHITINSNKPINFGEIKTGSFSKTNANFYYPKQENENQVLIFT